VPTTGAAHNRLLLFFLLRPFTVLMKQTRQAVCAVKLSIFLDVNEFKLELAACNFEKVNKMKKITEIEGVEWVKNKVLFKFVGAGQHATSPVFATKADCNSHRHTS
jgi:hypothetical protein